jgi:hypothetical protein
MMNADFWLNIFFSTLLGALIWSLASYKTRETEDRAFWKTVHFVGTVVLSFVLYDQVGAAGYFISGLAMYLETHCPS